MNTELSVRDIPKLIYKNDILKKSVRSLIHNQVFAYDLENEIEENTELIEQIIQKYLKYEEFYKEHNTSN